MPRTTTVLQEAASLDLTTVERVKPFLDIKAATTEHDDFLAIAITQASGRCDRYCDRVFIRQKYRDDFDVSPGVSLRLKNPPAADVVVTFRGATLTEGTDYALDKNGGVIRFPRRVMFSWSSQCNLFAVEYNGGFIAPPSAGTGALLRDAAEVEEACMRLVLAAFKGKGRDPLLKAHEQPTLGRREWWIGATAMAGGMPVEIAALLDDFALGDVG